MVHNAIPDLFCKVQPRAAPFQVFHHPEALLIMGEMPQQLGHGSLAGMTKGSMTNIMAQGNGISQILVKLQGPGYGPGNLGDLQAVGHAGTVMVPRHDIDLGLVLEAPEGLGMQDAVTITLILGAELALLHRLASFGLTAFSRIRRKVLVLEFFDLFPDIHLHSSLSTSVF